MKPAARRPAGGGAVAKESSLGCRRHRVTTTIVASLICRKQSVMIISVVTMSCSRLVSLSSRAVCQDVHGLPLTLGEGEGSPPPPHSPAGLAVHAGASGRPLALHQRRVTTLFQPWRACFANEKEMDICPYCHMNQSNDPCILGAASC